MHLAAPCAGQVAPLAAVPPFAHVHCFVAHCRFCDALGAVLSYSESPHAVQAMHDPCPVLAEYVPAGHGAHCDACCAASLRDPKFEPYPGPHDT